jgi:hypothetical protein
MKRPASAAARVSRAQSELAAAERECVKSALSWQQSWQRHRSAIALISGFSTGMALALFPPGWWARVGAALGTTAASTARSALVPAIVGAVLSHVLRSEDASRKTRRLPPSCESADTR